MKVQKKIFRKNTIFIKDGKMLEQVKTILGEYLWGYDETYAEDRVVSSGFLHYEGGVFYLSKNDFGKPQIESIEELKTLIK